MGNGIIFAEGAAWKKNRKVMSQLFTFDFLKSNIHEIT